MTLFNFNTKQAIININNVYKLHGTRVYVCEFKLGYVADGLQILKLNL